MTTITDRSCVTLGAVTAERRRRWWELARRYVDFCRRHRRIPTHRSRSADERALAAWITNARNRRAHLDSAQRRRLDEVDAVHETTVADRMDVDWQEMAERLIVYCADHDHPPRVDADSLDEHRLARWAESYRHRVRTGKVAASVVVRRAPMWDRVEQAWQRARDVRFGRSG